jgi:hypothetical protein
MCKGKAYYVDHVTVLPGVGVTTKETPQNRRNKAAYKCRGRLTIIETLQGEREAIIEEAKR